MVRVLMTDNSSDDAFGANEKPGDRSADRSLGATAFLRVLLSDLEARPSNAPGASASVEDEGKPVEASLGDLISRLDERAFGLMLLLLALPCCLPFVYGLPQIVALPMLALAAQLALGRSSPWLPKSLASRRFAIDGFRGVLDRATRYLGWIERIARPRLTALTTPMAARVTGVLLLAPCASILVPLPGTNTVPGIGVAIASIGMIERDGLLVLTGLLIGFAWVAALLIFGLEAASLLKEAIAARF